MVTVLYLYKILLKSISIRPTNYKLHFQIVFQVSTLSQLLLESSRKYKIHLSALMLKTFTLYAIIIVIVK